MLTNPFVGRRVEIGIGKESPRGTGAAATFWMPKTAITFDDKVNKALVRGSYGNITDAVMTAQTVSKWAEGDIEGEINANSFGLLLLALVGTSAAPSTLETGVYQHAYTLQNDNQHDSLSIHVKDPIDSVRFRLAMINSMTIDVALGEYVKYTANFVSRVHQDEAVQTPAYAVDHRFVHPNLTFKVNATAVSVKSLSLTIEKTVERMDILGTLDPEDILNKGIKIYGTVELNYEDRTWRNYMLNNTVRSMQITLEGSKLIGATKYAKLDMLFNKVHFFEWESSRDLAEIATQSINFEVMYELKNTRLWETMNLVNTHSTQY